MKDLIKKYIIEKWWVPTISFIGFGLIYFFFLTSIFRFIPSLLVGIILLLFLFISSIIQLFNKKWLAGILNLGITLCTVFIVAIFALAFMVFLESDADTFADDLKLPQNVKLEKPIDTDLGENFETVRPDSIQNLSKDKNDFQLYNSFQPGLYEYDVWIESNQSGTIFLKAFEITKGIALSVSSLKKRSSLRINDTNGEIQKFSTKEEFTIYEGDWGKPYGARFEIWFKPDNGEKEKKILEKNYIIEGWMR